MVWRRGSQVENGAGQTIIGRPRGGLGGSGAGSSGVRAVPESDGDGADTRRLADDVFMGTTEDMTRTSDLSEMPTSPKMRWQCPSCNEANSIHALDFESDLVCGRCGTEVQLSEDLLIPPTESEDPHSRKAPPQRILSVGKYPVVRFLGRGGMGEIWLGHHPNLDIPVAIKVLSAEMVERSPTYVERFLKEARTAAQVNHPNIVRIYDADQQDGMYFIVLEYMDGGDVLQLCRRRGGKLPPNEALDIVISVAEALVEAQRFHIIHRDIKPENIMLTKAGQTKLADLGIAKRASDSGGAAIHTQAVLGTPAYIAPEQALNSASVDTRADIYSLGATFFHLATGQVPFPAKSPFHMMYKHVKSPVPDPQAVEKQLPDSIAAVIRRMMQKDAADRYQDVSALLMDLYRIRDENATATRLTAIAAPAPKPESARSKSASKDGGGRTPSARLLVLAALFGVALLLGVFGARRLGQEAPQEMRDGRVDQLARLLLRRRAAARDGALGQPRPGDAGQPEDGAEAPPKPGNGAGGDSGGISPGNGDPGASGGDQATRFFPDLSPGDNGDGSDVTVVAMVPAQPAEDPTEEAPGVLEAKRAELQALSEAARGEAEAAWQDLQEAGLDPGQGIGVRLVELEQQLDDGLRAVEARRYLAATDAFEAVTAGVQAIRHLDAARHDARKRLDQIGRSRERAVARGAAEEPEVEEQWRSAEEQLQAAAEAFEAGQFRRVSPPGRAAELVYLKLAAVMPLIAQRNQARAQFRDAYGTVAAGRLRQFAPELFERVEEARRLADAADDYRRATGHYAAALDALNRALAEAERNEAAARRQTEREERDRARAERWEAAFATIDAARQAAGALKEDRRRGGEAVMIAQEAVADLDRLSRDTTEAERLQRLQTLREALAAMLASLSGAPTPEHAWLIPTVNIEMLPIASGVYKRGSANGNPNETPVHAVALSHHFWMSRHEITQAQYHRIAGGNPSAFRHRPDLPVETVTWEQASAFCRKLTERESQADRLPKGYEYRLPTEGEWEYCCRAGTETEFWFGDDAGTLHLHGNYCDRSFKGSNSWRDAEHSDRHAETAPVGSYPANGWGLHDMHGNVAEWCYDVLGDYPSKQVFDPVLTEGRTERVFRGGSWNGAASLCRSARRSAAAPSYAGSNLGFRIVLARIPIPTTVRKGWPPFLGRD